MADMTVKKKFSEKEIDDIVISQADDDSAWDEPVQIQRMKPVNISVPPDMARRALFFARLHREKKLEKWLTRIIQERIDIEESAFAEVKREMGIRTAG
jgi:hypothetical protein